MSKSYDNEKGREFWQAQMPEASTKKPKTMVRISFPEGTQNIKLLNLAEISAPGGVTITVKMPYVMGEASLGKITESIQKSGGTMVIEKG